MNAPRTVTLKTTDRGYLTVTCPAWCAGHNGAAGHRADIAHTSTGSLFTVETGDGTVPVMAAAFQQWPFSDDPDGRTVHVTLELNGDWYPCTARDLNRIASGLTVHPMHLRTLAAQLTDLLEGGQS